MSATSEFIFPAVHRHADALLLVLLTGVACGLARRHAARHGAQEEFPRRACVTALGLAFAGALLAEEVFPPAGYPMPAHAALVRLAALGLAALAAGLALTGAVRAARLRAELRRHADIARQLQQAKTSADEANRAKSDFLAVMSHEIRTPLNAVMGFAHLLSETPLDDVQRGYLSTITSEGTRLGSLINDLLDLSKIEEGRLVLERLPFAPAETARDVMRLLGARALKKKIELRFEAQLAGPLLVTGDPLRFRQVLVNLVDNAIKFTPHGPVTLVLAWAPPEGGRPPGRLTVRVRDTGIGIPADKVTDLFQMFVQADTSTARRYGGTGLGLAICQRLVGLMNGEIAVTSAPGQGSEFVFTLPMVPIGLPTPPLTPPPPNALAG